MTSALRLRGYQGKTHYIGDALNRYLARPKLLAPDPPSQALQPMRSVSLDLFAAAGHDWLAMVGRYSGYAWTTKLSNTTTRHLLSHKRPGSWILAGLSSLGQTTARNFGRNSSSSARPTGSHMSYLHRTIRKAIAWHRQLLRT